MSLSDQEKDELELLELEEQEAAYADSQAPKGPSKLASFKRGAEQGVMAGFTDEISGRIAQGVDYAKGLFGESPTEMAERYAKDYGIRVKGVPTNRDEMYTQVRDEERNEDRAAAEANPMSYGGGGLAGGLLTNVIPGVGLAKGAGYGKTALSAAAQGAAFGAGASESEDALGVGIDAGIGAGIGAVAAPVMRMGGEFLGDGVEYAGKKIGQLGNKLRGTAEDFAVKATGATGRQAEKFSDDAGRQLLNRKIVRFGDTPETIAGRAQQAVDDAGSHIGQILDDLDEQGVKSSVENIVSGVEKRISDLKKIPGNEKIIRQLENEVENLYERGESFLPVSVGEKAKRNFQSQTNYASPEADKKATAIMGREFREESERAALEASPNLAEAFIDEKKTIGLLKPIQKAAQNRASTLNQSPFGGLGDTAAAGAGLVSGGPAAAAAVAGRRIIAPRLSSMMAISTDAIANIARSAPNRLGKFAVIINNAAKRGPQAIAATNFILQQSQPEYRELMRQMQDEEEQ